ncbi:MAG: metallophosphoesterase [Smithella sp.]|nr:metallophosphoesterase [Smithella sp.]
MLADCGCVSEWENTFPAFLDKIWHKHKPELLFIVGDLVLTGRYSEYKQLLQYLEKYPAIFIAVPGNHDRPLIYFYRYFGSCSKVIDIGKWRFICLNTANKKFSWIQQLMLQKRIRENTVILSHVPPKFGEWEFYSLPHGSTKYFLDALNKNRQNIKSAFFGHLHGYSEQVYESVKMIVTGGCARSKAIYNNRYNEETPLEMIIFDVESGDIKVE